MKLILISILFLLSCSDPKQILPEEPIINQLSFDLDKIKSRGKLIALTRFNANSYFIYKGEPMGYEYDMLKLFCEEIGVELEIKVPKHWNDLIPALLAGEGDIIASNMTITKDRSKQISFADHHTTTRQVLIQRMPEIYTKLKKHEIDRLLIRNQIDLIGKDVHIFGSSSYFPRLQNLSDEIGGEINIKLVSDSLDTEDLIKLVSEKKYNYTISDENIARINKIVFPNIDIETPVSFPQRIAWGVRPNSDSLRISINSWIKKMKRSDSPIYNLIYNKYYKNNRRIKRRLKSDRYFEKSGKLSNYDALIKKYAKKLDWDWLLLASQIRQESGFNSKQKSWAGAEGLMQVMPRTANEFGIKNLFVPEDNLSAGTQFIQWLENYWKDIPNEDERMKFVLASYNVGQGHVQDARRLTKKFGKDINLWEDVSEFLLKKSNKKFYKDDVVYYGYCRGEEPFNYVREIIYRYEHYKLNQKNKS